jgi:hypothetical protein
MEITSILSRAVKQQGRFIGNNKEVYPRDRKYKKQVKIRWGRGVWGVCKERIQKS